MTTHAKIKTYVDPVCGMNVDPTGAIAKTCYNGIELYFCSKGCHRKFETAPQDYVTTRRKGFWRRYLERLNKSTGGRPPTCCH